MIEEDSLVVTRQDFEKAMANINSGITWYLIYEDLVKAGLVLVRRRTLEEIRDSERNLCLDEEQDLVPDLNRDLLEPEKESLGVTYIDTSKDGKGFQRLFEAVKTEIFLPALKYMPTQEELRFRMMVGIREAQHLKEMEKEKPMGEKK